jgi:hypothetical protein
VSTDDGGTWSSSILEDTTTATGGFYGRASDPSVAYDANTDSWLVGYLGITLAPRFDEPTRSGIEVVRSASAGSFGKPITVARAPRGIVYDKPWIACDGHRTSTYFGRCWAVWDELGLREGPRGVVLASTSKDGGSHWSPPVRTADRMRGFGGVPLVRPDGSVIVSYLNTEHPLRPRIDAFVSTGRRGELGTFDHDRRSASPRCATCGARPRPPLGGHRRGGRDLRGLVGLPLRAGMRRR